MARRVMAVLSAAIKIGTENANYFLNVSKGEIIIKSLADCHPGGINSHTCLYVPSFVSDEAKGLLEGLLKHNPHERLGAGIAGSEELKAHPFFTGVDWHALEYS